jgi:hypothetical protein
MIATRKPIQHHDRSRKAPAWHTTFLAMLPAIQRHANIASRYLDHEAREEFVQEVTCNCCRAFARLVEQGREHLAAASALARFGVAQARSGRKVGGRLNCKDILAEYCRMRKNLHLEHLDRYDAEEDTWQEVVVEDRRCGPAEVAATRLDFAEWMRLLPTRRRRIAAFLAQGETTNAASQRFRLSAGRISQIRRELLQSWSQFQGEPPDAELDLAVA